MAVRSPEPRNCEHRHEDCDSRHLHGEGPCRPKARSLARWRIARRPYTVKQFQPPTISCSANPSTVAPGDSSTITANGVSPQNRPLTYSYSATAGSVSAAATSTATLNTTGAAPGTITVTATWLTTRVRLHRARRPLRSMRRRRLRHRRRAASARSASSAIRGVRPGWITKPRLALTISP